MIDNHMAKGAKRELHGANLKRIRKQAGYRSSRAAALALGVPIPTFYMHESGGRDYRNSAQKYAQFFGVGVETLIGSNAKEVIVDSRPNVIPHIEFSTLAHTSLEESFGPGTRDITQALNCGRNCFTVTNPDRSMTGPGESRPIMQGDILGFRPSKVARPGDYVLAKIDTFEEPIFRIYYPVKGGGATFNALNPNVEPIQVTRSTKWRILATLQFVAFAPSTIG